MDFSRGKPKTKLLRKKGAVRGSGTTITFEPDPTIFARTQFNGETIGQRIEIASYLHKGVRFNYVDETAEGGTAKTAYLHENGIVDFLGKTLKDRSARPTHDAPFTFEKELAEGRLELVFQWTEHTEEYVKSYVNGIPTGSGGTHENGLRAGINKAIRNYIVTHKLTPRGVKVETNDIREGMHGILSVFIADPQFQGQTKDRLNNPECTGMVDNAVRPALEQWLNSNSSVAQAICARIFAAARARAASRAASAAVSRKSATNKLTLPRQAQRLQLEQPRRQRAVHRRRRLGRRIREAGKRSEPPGHLAFAWQSPEHREREPEGKSSKTRRSTTCSPRWAAASGPASTSRTCATNASSSSPTPTPTATTSPPCCSRSSTATCPT